MKEIKQMQKGVIIKGIGGFYYVDTIDGVFECRARGKFRKEGIKPLVGDKVTIQIDSVDDKTGTVTEILPRKNTIYRPKAANVDRMILVFAAANPAINFNVLDKFIVLAEQKALELVLCINKIDLAAAGFFAEIGSIYAKAGYTILQTSARDGVGLEELKSALHGATSVFAGPSGTGKSSLINAVSSFSRATGEVSKKLKRGKHTTREAVLMALNPHSYIIDTPGFTSMALEGIEKEQLRQYFLEFIPFEEGCRFNTCSHIDEKDCAVKAQVGIQIHPSRYKSYAEIYQELKEMKPAWARKEE